MRFTLQGRSPVPVHEMAYLVTGYLHQGNHRDDNVDAPITSIPKDFSLEIPKSVPDRLAA